ncbi:hypothetical protein BOSEA31B_11444 [Hyphomicrobiales bacterium]|nr:hypothetical protein BOSEA31B_11444 [Hyphomicrobiales bacterium]CAI0342807.1 hypothetical protein BO1005MUT1_10100 [Hyphomicrobiales bacterium]
MHSVVRSLWKVREQAAAERLECGVKRRPGTCKCPIRPGRKAACSSEEGVRCKRDFHFRGT